MYTNDRHSIGPLYLTKKNCLRGLFFNFLCTIYVLHF